MDRTLFLNIPADVLSDKRLLPGEKILLSEIRSLTKQRGFCFMKNKTFAEKLNISVRQLQRYLHKLSQNGLKFLYVDIDKKKKQDSIYYTERKIYLYDEWLRMHPEEVLIEDLTEDLTASSLDEVNMSSDDAETITEEVKETSEMSPGGMTSTAHRVLQKPTLKNGNIYKYIPHPRNKTLVNFETVKNDIKNTYESLQNDGYSLPFTQEKFFDFYYGKNGKYFTCNWWMPDTFNIADAMQYWIINTKDKVKQKLSAMKNNSKNHEMEHQKEEKLTIPSFEEIEKVFVMLRKTGNKLYFNPHKFYDYYFKSGTGKYYAEPSFDLKSFDIEKALLYWDENNNSGKYGTLPNYSYQW